jgi:hypothetical protein
MSVYSRAYLQGLPEKKKQEWIETNVLQPIMGEVYSSAGNGETSYMYKLSNMHSRLYIVFKGKMAPYPTVDELIPAICHKFPDCAVTYEEKWEYERDDYGQKKVLSKGIVINWACILGPEVART